MQRKTQRRKTKGRKVPPNKKEPNSGAPSVYNFTLSQLVYSCLIIN
jgi:hypothetical protein